MDEEGVRQILVRACAEAGSQRAWADANGISPQYVSDMLTARREPAGKMLVALRVEKIVTYRMVRPEG